MMMMMNTPSDTTPFDVRHKSYQIMDGPARAPHRAFHLAMGLTQEDFKKPFIGVANTWNEVTPCNITH